MCALTHSKIIEIEKFIFIPNNNVLKHFSRLLNEFYECLINSPKNNNLNTP